MKIIEITSPKYGKFNTYIDNIVYEKIKHLTLNIGIFYQKGTKRISKIYVKYILKRKNYYLHRLIMNAKKGQQVDHINGNGLDNRKENLRLCTQRENLLNRLKSIKNTTGYKGVSYKKKNKNYVVNIGVNGKTHHVGVFNNKIDAAKAYNKEAIKYFGEFAKLNDV